MKRKLLSVLLMVVLALPISLGMSGLSVYADDGDYIEIRTVEDLYNVRNEPSANYILMNDIDLREATAEGAIYDNNGKGWEAIPSFTGVFDGNGHTIRGMRQKIGLANVGGYNCAGGLFLLNDGIIKNLHFVSDNSIYLSLYGSAYRTYGAIAGMNGGTVSNCSFEGTIDGLIYTFSSVGRGQMTLGGITGGGSTKTGTVSECYCNADFAVYRNSQSVGDAGYMAWHIGGICGGSWQNIENCYSINYALAPYAESIKNSYAIGADGTTSGVFYNASGTAKTLNENQLKSKASYSGFDFSKIWTIETATDYQYPQLRNNMMDDAKHVDVIEWKSEPSKIEYYTDEDIDPTGGVFRAYYIDDTHEDIEVTKDMLSGYDMTQLGMQTVTVTFREGSLTFDILTSTRPEVKSLTLETMPDKTEFARGTSFDFTGATAKVEYVNGTSDIIPIKAEDTTGGNINQSGTYTITFEKFGKSLTFEVKVVPIKPTGIRISSMPDMTTYIEGQSLDLTGLVVKLDYNNGKSETITDYTVGEYTNTVGTKEIAVTYEDFSTSFNVEFVEKKLTNIMVTTQPTKAKYVVGEKFDNTGMVVKAVYDNGISEEITDYTVSEITDATGWQNLTVSYGGKTTTIKVMVEAKELVSIFVAQMPTKTTYIEGEKFDPEGMVVKANYNNVLEEEITDYTLSGTTLNKVGESKITVLYEGMTATFNVTVVEKQLVKITVTPPTKTEYIAGEELDKTGMVVNAVYDNGKSEEVTDYTVSGFGDSEEDNVVTIEYGGKTSAFIVTIHTPADKWTVTQAPSCTTGGSQELHCADCGKVLKTEQIDALDHDWGSWETVESPSCVDKGSQKRVCKRCSVEESKDVDPNGHTWTEEYEVDLDPTCTLEGSESWHCSVCGISDPDHTRAIEKLPHNLGEWTTTKEATCAVSGVKQRGCSDCDYLETEEIPATGIHTFGDWNTTEAATCTEQGSKERECSVCHLVETEVIPANGHTLVPVEGKDATSTEPGYEAYWKCSGCETLFSDAEGQNKISEPIVIDPTGPTQEEIERAEAFDNLSNAITDAKSVSNSDGKYTPESFQALQNAIANAERVAANENATTAELNTAKAAVAAAKAGLILKPAVVAPAAPAEIVDLPAVKISKPAAAKKSVNVKWKKVTKKNLKKIQGIEIQVATDPGFTDIVKTATAGKKKTSKKIKGLTSKQTYYVRIRAYKDAADGRHVSAWKAKKVKIK